MSRRVRGLTAIIVAVSTIVLGVSGCTTSAPEIVELFWQLNHRFDLENGTYVEELVCFVHVSDADGTDDIESIYLIHDGSELYWRLQSDSWEETLIDEEFWLGHGSITSYDGGSFPRGSYRVIVVDLAGERAESSLYLSADEGDPADTVYPVLEPDGDELLIVSSEERRSLWFYDGSGDVVKVVSTTSDVVPLERALSRQELERTVGVSVFVYDDRRGIGAISGRYVVE